MNETDLLKIINTYGVIPQLKYFQSEVFEFNEAVIDNEWLKSERGTEYINHIAEEMADVTVMLKQFQYYYGIENEMINNIMDYKIKRQLERIKQND